MIRVTQQPEPTCFDSKVRQLGQSFLQNCPSPHGKEWRNHDYWQKVHKDLYKVYNGRCAYTGMWFSAVDRLSVDHFRPKSICPDLAYEWSNYRLTTQKTNAYKANHDDIIDPFSVQPEWFILEIPTCLINVGNNVSISERTKIEHTINVLKLNDDNEYVESRKEIILSYIAGAISLNNMNEKYPFIACELQRQNLTDISTLETIFKTKSLQIEEMINPAYY
ncbi:MAG: hypothetical protein LBC02_04450 [Planctomycetaceae bacterium]|nr:hypothetical protein [Planctomycetaceae bacterium]